MDSLETLLDPVSPEAPSGELLEYDPAYTGLFELARGKPEQRMGASVIAAEPPNWRKVEESARALLGRTKDLRVAVLLVKARLRNDGLGGLFQGLAYLRALLERRWDTLHPQLDAEDGDDPSMRTHALVELLDAESVLGPLRDAELASARGVGRICVRDLSRPPANGSAEPPAEPPPPIEPVFAASDGAALARSARAAAAAVGDLRALEAFVRERVGPERAPDLSTLRAPLELVAKVLAAHAGAADRAPPAAAAAPDAAGSSGAVGAIKSREDVLRALDGLCAYFERNEPSSPIPLLLRRSKRLVAMSFLDIVRDLAPEAAPQIEALRGRNE